MDEGQVRGLMGGAVGLAQVGEWKFVGATVSRAVGFASSSA